MNSRRRIASPVDRDKASCGTQTSTLEGLGFMSALGQKQTLALQKAMSALLPKADMCSALAHVCFGPKADIEWLIRSPRRRGQACRLRPSAIALRSVPKA